MNEIIDRYKYWEEIFIIIANINFIFVIQKVLYKMICTKVSRGRYCTRCGEGVGGHHPPSSPKPKGKKKEEKREHEHEGEGSGGSSNRCNR